MAKSQKLFSFVRKNSLAILLVVVLLFAFSFSFAFSVKREGFAKAKKAQDKKAQDKKAQDKKAQDKAKAKLDEITKKCDELYGSSNNSADASNCVSNMLDERMINLNLNY